MASVHTSPDGRTELVEGKAYLPYDLAAAGFSSLRPLIGHGKVIYRRIEDDHHVFEHVSGDHYEPVWRLRPPGPRAWLPRVTLQLACGELIAAFTDANHAWVTTPPTGLPVKGSTLYFSFHHHRTADGRWIASAWDPAHVRPVAGFLTMAPLASLRNITEELLPDIAVGLARLSTVEPGSSKSSAGPPAGLARRPRSTPLGHRAIASMTSRWTPRAVVLPFSPHRAGRTSARGRAATMTTWLLTGMGVVLVAASMMVASGSGPAQQHAAAMQAPVAAQGTDEPVRLEIPAIEVSAAITPVGLTAEEHMAVPAFGQSGWFRPGPKPGELGHAVIAGHVDSATGPDVFYRLHTLETGDEVRVLTSAGLVRAFRVDFVTRQPKEDMPASTMWQPSDRSQLALVTCAGTFDRKQRSYSDNLVVYATAI